MNLSQIIQMGRRRTDDVVEDYLFPDSVYTQWANNAITEACLRSRNFRDDSTSAVCNVALTTGVASVTLDPSIVSVRRAIITDGQRKSPLELLTFGEIDHTESRWDTTQQGEPAAAVFDMSYQTVRLYPVPDTAYTMNLVVWRLPITAEELVASSDVPTVLPAWMHKDLAPWIAHEFYSQRDVDVYDPEQAAIELADFTSRLGDRPTAYELFHWGRDKRRSAYAHFM